MIKIKRQLTAASVSEIQTPKAAKIVGALLALTGILGILILAFDGVLAESAPLHLYALVSFVAIDFLLAAVVLAKPSKMIFTATGRVEHPSNHTPNRRRIPSPPTGN